MGNEKQSLEEVKILRAGNWESSKSTRSGEIYNPSTGKVIGRVPFCTAGEVDRVVQAAAEAFAGLGGYAGG